MFELRLCWKDMSLHVSHRLRHHRPSLASDLTFASSISIINSDSNGNAVAPPPCNPVDQPMQAAWQQQHQQQQQQQQQHQNAPSPPTQYVIQSTPFPPSQVVYSSQMSRSRAMTGSSSYGSPHTSGPLSPAQDLSSWITAERRRALLNGEFSSRFRIYFLTFSY